MTTKKSTFSPEVFGEELAEILDGLLRVQESDNAGFEGVPTPFLSIFATPSGVSWYEADMLTRHYHMIDISVRFAMKDPEFAELFAEKQRADGSVRPALSMLDVHRMLFERWTAVIC
jgi:hypothetical protein